MARDIEEFLRKAAERRLQQKQGGGAPPPSQPASSEPRRRIEPARVDDYEVVDDVEIVDEGTARSKNSGGRKPLTTGPVTVAEHVQQHLDTSGIREKTKQLGSQVAAVKEKFESKVHQNLDRDICEVDDSPLVEDHRRKSPENQLAIQLKNMLAQPETIAQAILISEILKRPDFAD